MSGQGRRREPAALLEDLDFMDSTGTGAIDAAKRTEFPSVMALEKWLQRHDRYDLWLSLKRRDPQTAHEDLKKSPSQMTSVDTIAAVIAAASRSSRTRTKNKAARLAEMVDELRATIEAERAEDDLRESARKEIERLERQLREAKSRLRGDGGSTTLSVDSSVSAAELRRWAASNGIDCPAVGRVPATVREAFAATEGEASA